MGIAANLSLGGWRESILPLLVGLCSARQTPLVTSNAAREKCCVNSGSVGCRQDKWMQGCVRWVWCVDENLLHPV